MEGHIESAVGPLGHASSAQRRCPIPVTAQQDVLRALLAKGKDTAFGKDHDLKDGLSVAEFQARVPVRDYEGFEDTWNGP